LFLTSFVSAIPKDFEVSNVYWAAEGTMQDSDEINQSFLMGLVELSWESEKGKTNSLIVYLDYNGQKYYSSSLGLTKDLNLNIGITEAQFYPLENYASENAGDKISQFSLIIPISQEGKINFEGVKFSKLNEDLVIPDSFRTENSDAENLFPELFDLVTCSKGVRYDSASTKMCDDDTMSKEEFDKCRADNEKVQSINFYCSILCLKNFYGDTTGTAESSCFIFDEINFLTCTSEYIDFSELTKLNPNLEEFNPWRAGP